MAPITTTAEIARPTEDVFAYVTDPSALPEWQEGVVSGHMDGPTTHAGSKCTTVRKIGGRQRGTVEPLADGSRSRLTIEVDFTGHGIGKLRVPLIVRRQAARQIPEGMSRLKQRLEAGPSTG